MGRVLLVCRLAARDLRRHPAEAVMVLLMFAFVTTTLTVGIALNGVINNPYQQTREATAGPDVTADASPGPFGQRPDLASITPLIHASGVTGHSGPFPYAATTIRAHGHKVDVLAEGRDTAPAPVDQPEVTEGSWVREGGVVIERGFAEALGVRVGDQVTLGGRSFPVVGIAITAAVPAYPVSFCNDQCDIPMAMQNSQSNEAPVVGLVWVTRPDAKSLAASASPRGYLGYLLDLKLAHPAQAQAFVAAHTINPGPGPAHTIGPGAAPAGGSVSTTGPNLPILYPWQRIRDVDNLVVENEQKAMLFGGWLLAALAFAGLAVLAGRRMTEQTRRVGLLKAVGGTPGLAAAVLLAEHVIVALLAAATGLVAGRLLATPLSRASAGLTGAPGAPSITVPMIAVVVAVALAVATAATIVPAIRAARLSTISALADAARSPRRRAGLIAVSARLPVSLLLGLRLIARRPRRGVLNAFGIAITTSGVVAVLASFAYNARNYGGLDNLRIDRDNELTAIITVMLVCVAAINAMFIAWATVLDARHSSALARALGATPGQVSAGISAAQLLPALPGAIIGIPLGIYLYHGATKNQLTIPPLWQLLAVLLGALLVITGLTAIPARAGARRPPAEILQAETA